MNNGRERGCSAASSRDAESRGQWSAAAASAGREAEREIEGEQKRRRRPRGGALCRSRGSPPRPAGTFLSCLRLPGGGPRSRLSRGTYQSVRWKPKRSHATHSHRLFQQQQQQLRNNPLFVLFLHLSLFRIDARRRTRTDPAFVHSRT